jgi:hypothetical protein
MEIRSSQDTSPEEVLKLSELLLSGLRRVRAELFAAYFARLREDLDSPYEIRGGFPSERCGPF